MKAVKIYFLIVLSAQLYAQDSMIYQSNVMELNNMVCALEGYEIEDKNPTIIEHNKIAPFKATFYKAYQKEYVLVEVDSSSEFAYVILSNDSIKIKTNLSRFIVPSDFYSLEIRYAPCKYVKTGVDVRSCESELSYTLIPPSSPYDDDGVLIINKPSNQSNWYFEHANDLIVGDTLYNVRSGYYKIKGATSNGCKTLETIPFIYSGGHIAELKDFDYGAIMVTKG